MTELRLILGDQLNSRHSWFQCCRDDVVYLMLELRQEMSYVLHHAQKLLAILAAMRDFARHLQHQGHRVHYVRFDQPDDHDALETRLDALVEHYQATSFQWQLPDEWRLDQQLRNWSLKQTIPCQSADTEHFFSHRLEVDEFFKNKTQWRMESFYRHMRKKHHILLDEQNNPVGKKWNFDQENRKPWHGNPPVPMDVRPKHDHQHLWQALQSGGIRYFGADHAEALRWPLNRFEALEQLNHFIRHVLTHFGDYQDAMHREEPLLFHSMLSFALNTKMLDPREVVAAAEQAGMDGRASLSAVEGFIRQILGWREYIRGIYWARMPEYRSCNHLDHHQPLPSWFWNGQTKMNCVAHAIGQSLEYAYAHHIQRLMVIGNIALLAGLSPSSLHEWYLGVYIDAFEWVELPNTLGMSQFADGGLLATKPYVSSGAYIHRMSNYCQGCRYQQRLRLGELACPFNTLYWDFFQRHRNILRSNPRIAMVYKQLDQMSTEEIKLITARAHNLRINLEYV